MTTTTYQRDLMARVGRIRAGTGMHIEACKRMHIEACERAAQIELLRERIEQTRMRIVMRDEPVTQDSYDLLSLIDNIAELMR